MTETDARQPDTYTRLALETARIPWPELERHFATGRLIAVADELDLVAVATACADDDGQQVRTWMDAGQVQPVTDAQARAWQARGSLLWAVVVKPWILVQERAASD